MTHSTRFFRHGNPDAVHPNKQTTEERHQRLKERQEVYRKTPKGRLAYLLKRQRRRHLEGEVTLSADEALRVYEAFDCRCFRCRRVSDLTLDHHIPLVLGGKLEVGNVVILCRRCNGLKADLAPEQFYPPEELSALSRILSSTGSTTSEAGSTHI